MSEALAVLRRDARFAPLIHNIGPIELRARRPYFWLLCRAVIAQQVSSAAARTISGRVNALYPQLRYPDPVSILATPTEALRSAGLSRQKARYLHALADAFSQVCGSRGWTMMRSWSA
jgi:DNA-3-methyladenine glycosylase II